MPDQVTTAVQNTDWASVAIKAIDVDPRNVVVIALVVLLFFMVYMLGKFIDAKFISRQVTKVITAAGGVENSNKCAIESNEKLARDLDRKFRDHADALDKDRRETREEMAKLRRELNDRLDHELLDLKKALGALAAGNKSTAEAIAKYQSEANYLKTNFELIVSNIRKKNLGGGA